MDRPFWNEEIETIAPAALHRLESELLRRQVAYVCHTSPHYAWKREEASVRLEDVKSIDDLARIPLTEKGELRASQHDGSLFGFNRCAPVEKILRIVGGLNPCGGWWRATCMA